MATPLQSFGSTIDRQDGLITRSQLRRCSVSESEARAQLVARRWRALNELVVCTHNGPLTASQARWAAVLTAQPPVALASLSVLDTLGVRGFPTTAVHILVVRGARVLPVPDVELAVHESRRFCAQDIVTASTPPITSLERATIDAAVWSRESITAARIVVAPIQQRRTTADRLLAELAGAGRVRHRRGLAALLADLSGGAEALSEVAFIRWCRRHGFPRPILQVRLDAAGRRRYIDAVFRGRDGRRVLVEIDGGVHLTLTTRWKDTAKDNDAVLAGELTLRFPSVAIHTDDPAAVRQLAEALGLSERHVARAT